MEKSSTISAIRGIINSKRAVNVGFIATFIILLIIAVFLIKQIYTIDVISTQSVGIEQCKKSVELSALTSFPGMNTEVFNEQIDCPTVYKQVNLPDEDKIKRRLANDLAECWYKFSGGQQDIFNAVYKDQEYYCVVCSVTDFTGSAKNMEIKGFANFLQTEYAHPAHTGKKKMKYLEYLQPYKSNGFEEADIDPVKEAVEDYDDSIITDTPYAAMFIYSNKGFNDVLEVASFSSKVSGLVTSAVAVIAPAKKLQSKLTRYKYIVVGALSGTVYAVGEFADKDPNQWQAATALIPYTKEELNRISCNELPVKSDVRKEKP